MSQDPYSKLAANGIDFVPTIHHDTYAAIDPTKANLTGKTVLITGASKGIGLATAISFAKAGASGIILGARSSLTEATSSVLSAAKSAHHPPPKVLALELDISSESSVSAAAARVRTEFNDSLDILINNAGYLEKWLPITASNPSEWWKSFSVNLNGTYLMCRSFLPLLLNSSSKTIVNVVSAGAHRTAYGASAYQTSKFALLRFTEFLVAEYGGKGLVAFAAHPGGVMTELARGMPEYMMSVLTDTPELAGDAFVWYLKERREWLAGRYVSVSWDVGELEGKKDEVVKGELLKVRMALGGLG